MDCKNENTQCRSAVLGGYGRWQALWIFSTITVREISCRWNKPRSKHVINYQRTVSSEREEPEIKGVGKDCVDHDCEKIKKLCSGAAGPLLSRFMCKLRVHIQGYSMFFKCKNFAVFQQVICFSSCKLSNAMQPNFPVDPSKKSVLFNALKNTN